MLKILALSDFSPNTRHALRVSMQLARLYGGEVIFAHAMPKPPVPATAPQSLFSELLLSDQGKWQEKLREEVQQLFQALGIRHKEVMYQVKVVPMPLVEAAAQLAAEHTVDLILMGSTGSSGLRRIIMGNNTLQMIKRTTRPLLVVPQGFTFAGFANITLAIRPDRFRHRGGINLVLRLARSYGATLHFFFVLDEGGNKPEPEGFLTRHNLWQEVKEYPFHAYAIPPSGRIKALEEHIELTRTDLVVVFPGSKSIWEELFSDSISEKMADRGKTPLLVFPKAAHPKP